MGSRQRSRISGRWSRCPPAPWGRRSGRPPCHPPEPRYPPRRPPSTCPRCGEDHQLDVPTHIFDGDEAHVLARLGHVRPHTCDDPRHAHLLTRRGFGQLPREVRHHLGEGIHYRAERVVGDVQADQLALPFRISRRLASRAPLGRVISSLMPDAAPNMVICPASEARKCEVLIDRIWSCMVSMALRGPNISMAPTLIRHSSARLLTRRRSTRRPKSLMSLKGLSLRASRMASTGPLPTFFTAPSPKRIVLLPPGGLRW